MVDNLRKFIGVYFAFLRAHLRRILEYRSSFFLGIIAILSRHIIGVCTIWVIFSRVKTLGGWEPYEVVYLYGYVSLVTAIWHFFFANTIRMEFMVRNAELDRYLVRPISPLFQVLLWYFDDDALGDLIPAVVLLWIASVKLDLHYSLGTAVVFLVGLVGGVLIHFGIHLLLCAWSFWFIKSRALINLFTEVKRFSEYPLHIFTPSLQLVFTLVVPIAFVGYYQVSEILNDQAHSSR